jgi:beta-galactosidase
VSVHAKLKSDDRQGGDYTVRVALLDDGGRVAASQERTVSLAADARQVVVQDLGVRGAHLWNGVQDPYLYHLVAELRAADGRPVDKVVQRYGIRQMQFDTNRGFFLNGQHVRLHGVAMHQDYLGKGWALSAQDWDTSFNLITEMGANAVRFGHYPFPEHALQKADQLGLVIWAEAALGLGTTVNSCSTTDATEAYVQNAQDQLEEMIRQQFNHA